MLGGGGGRGAAQLGVIRALAERGLEPDACVGTSVGALNAAAVAAHPMRTAVEHLEAIWAGGETRAVFRPEPWRMIVNRVRRRPYLRSGACIRELVSSALTRMGPTTFEELRIPLHIVMTDLCAGEPVVVSSGPLADAHRASSAIPGVLPPVEVAGRLCVDGGVTENCSIGTAAALMPERIIAIDLSADGPLPALRRWGEVVDRMMQMALHSRVVADFDRFSGRLPVTLICPRADLSLRRPRFADFATLRDAAFRAADRLFQRIGTADGALNPGVFYLPVPAER